MQEYTRKERHLNRSEERVLKANVDTDNVEHDRGALVRLEGRRDGELGGRVAVEDVDELLLLNGANEDGTALGIGGEVLAGYNATAARAAERLLVHLVEPGKGGGGGRAGLGDIGEARFPRISPSALASAAEGARGHRGEGSEKKNLLCSGLYSRMVMRPLSEPTTM